MRKYCSQAVLENFFEPCVLYLLLKKPGYGYELSKKLKESCHCQVNIGNLYRGLSRLVKSGNISKTMVKSEIGPMKAVYTITPAGKKYLAAWIDSLSVQQKAISKLITNYKNHYETG